MKLNNLNYFKKININKNPKNIDGFWDDCIKEEPLLSNISFKNPVIKPKYNNTIINLKIIKKINYRNKIYDQHKSGIINNCYKKLRQKIPNLENEEKNNISKKLKIKNSLKRSLLLYSYGLEVLKANKVNASQNKIHKEQEELKLCTWKPKLNKFKKLTKSKIFENKINNEYKSNKNYDKKIENIKIDNECTFWPRINKNPNLNLKKIFNRSKSMLLYTDRDNSSFILRYKKARDEYMIKRFIKLSEKDDSYNSYFKELTSSAIDHSYKNYLNVNTSKHMYNNGLNENKNNNGRIFNLSASNNSNISNYNSNNSNNIVIPKIKKSKSKKYYVGLLKKQLRLIDLKI